MLGILIVDDNAYSCLGMTYLLRQQMKYSTVIGWNFSQAKRYLHQDNRLPCKRLIFHLSPSSVSPLWRQLQLLQQLLDTKSFSACTVLGSQMNEGIGKLLYILMEPIVAIDSRLPVISLITNVCHKRPAQTRQKVMLTHRQQQLLDDTLSGFSVERRARLLGLSPKTIYKQRSDALALLGFASVHAFRVKLVLRSEERIEVKDIL